MGLPVVASKSSNYADSNNLTITKPTGVAVGDVLVAHIGFVSSSVEAVSTPSGWTKRQETSSGTRRHSLFTKIADSSDVSASNYTWTTTNGSRIIGHIMRVTGAVSGQEITTSEIDETSNVTAYSFTAASTPLTTNSLLIASVFATYTDGVATVSSYTSTPSKTWTEEFDFGWDSGVIDPTLAVASAPANSLTQITAYGSTLSTIKQNVNGTLLIILGSVDATGDASFQTTTVSTFASGGTANASATSALNTTDSEANTNSGQSISTTQWSNEAKPTTTWVNTPKL